MTRLQRLAVTHGLNQYATGFVTNDNALDDARFLIGGPVPTYGINFEYFQFDSDAGFRIPNTLVASDDPLGTKLDFGGTRTPGILDEHGANSPFPVIGMQDANLIMTLKNKARLAAQALKLGRLQRVLTLAQATATAAAAIDLTNAATQAVKLVQDQVDNVILASGGTAAGLDIRILWPTRVVTAFSNHATVQARVNGGSTKKDPSTIAVSMGDFDRLIGKGTVNKESTASYVSSARGLAVTKDFLMGTSAYVCAVSQVPNDCDPSWAKLFQMEGEDGSIFEPKYATHFANTQEYAIWRWAEKLQATNAAAIIRIPFTIP